MAIRALNETPDFLGCDVSSADAACLRAFVTRFGARAYRRPITDVEQEQFLGLFAALVENGDPRTATEGLISAMLQSPKFLYRPEFGGGDAHAGGDGTLNSFEMASRLSYLLWGTMPDEELFQVAAADSLLEVTAIETQAQRLWDDPRADEVAWRFIGEWFDMDRAQALRFTTEVYSSFNSYQRRALEDSARTFVRFIFREEGARLEALLTSPVAFVGTSIKTIYDVNALYGSARRFDMDPAQRAGILTHPLWLAVTSAPGHTDPIQRGKFIRERLLCEALPPLPTNVVPLPPEAAIAPTARERYSQHAADPECAGCHAAMDPIGFAFEHYTAVGKWRDTENDAAIDASGTLTEENGTVLTFADAVDLTHQLATDDAVALCAVRQWFRFAYGREETTDDAETIQELSDAFDAGGRSFDALVFATVRSPAFRTKSLERSAP